MPTIERKRGSFKPMVFNVDFSALGKTIADVSDIFFVIKSRLSDLDSDALMLKSMVDGITIDSESTVIVPWDATEYDAFVIERTYQLGLFIKFIGDPVADEDVSETFQITIVQDFLHDN